MTRRSFGEAEGMENERLRIELAARATLAAIKQAEGEERVLALEGCRLIDAFERSVRVRGRDDAGGPGEHSDDW